MQRARLLAARGRAHPSRGKPDRRSAERCITLRDRPPSLTVLQTVLVTLPHASSMIPLHSGYQEDPFRSGSPRAVQDVRVSDDAPTHMDSCGTLTDWGPRFYHGCSTFLPVFDANVDTYDALHERSPFAVDVICMVAAKVRDGGGEFSITPLRESSMC